MILYQSQRTLYFFHLNGRNLDGWLLLQPPVMIADMLRTTVSDWFYGTVWNVVDRGVIAYPPKI